MASRSTSLALFSFKGIRVLVHWTFPLLIAWVTFSGISDGMDTRHILQEILFILIIFCCVVMHEFGHALTALRFGIRTRNIMLLPIGGVASLERIPEKPKQELLVALAGPAVNLAIVLLLGVPLLLMGKRVMLVDLVNGPVGLGALFSFMITANLGLLVFNLIPAFPMDGGRVLRSILAFNMDRVKATRIATILGRVIALGFIFLAFYWREPMIGLVGLFVIVGASAELKMVRTQSALSAIRVRQVMRTRFWSMPHDAPVAQAADELLAGGDHVLFLTRQGSFDRAIPRETIIKAMQEGHQNEVLATLSGVLPEAVHPDMDVKDAYLKLGISALSMLPVIEGGRLIGVLESDNLAEYMELHPVSDSTRK